jgi:hypothetical protein
MFKVRSIASKSRLTALFVCGAMSIATAAGDLSRYRSFRFGTDLPTVARQVGASVSQAKVIHRRPALIQELEWRPRSLGPSLQAEPANEVVFSFYNGELYRIVVSYDRYEIEGLTAQDIIDAVSVIYGPAIQVAAPVKNAWDSYSGRDEPVARWQDSQYAFDLVRPAYGPSFKLIGVLKELDSSAQDAIVEAKRLDDREAPQRDAARVASEQEAARAQLEKSRLVNKPRFRP